jgi:hypothetical protein
MKMTLRMMLSGHVLLGLLCWTPAVAQDTAAKESSATIQDGTYRIRLTTGEEITARLLKLGPDVLQILVKGQRQEMPFDQVLQVDREGDSLKNGAIIGAVVAGIWCTAVCGQGLGDGSQLPVAVAVNAGVGALVGAGLDATITHRTTIYRKPSGAAAALDSARVVVAYRFAF